MSMARVLARLEGVASASCRASRSATRASPTCFPRACASRTPPRCTRPRPPSSPSPSRSPRSGSSTRSRVDTAPGAGRRSSRESLADRRVLLLGYGGVGKAIAARLAPFEVELTAVARRRATRTGCRCTASTSCPTLLPHAEIVDPVAPRRRRDPAHRRRRVPVGAARRRAGRQRRPRAADRHRCARRPRRAAAASARRSTSPTPSRCPRGTRSGAFPAC